MFNKILVLFIAVCTLFSCDSSETTGGQTTNDGFNRGAMLANIADNIIIPAYEDFGSKMTTLKTTGQTFTNNPNQVNLDALRASWLTAYTTWQQIEMFNIGKAEELQYSFFMNIYPLTVEDVETNIARGTYDLSISNNHDAQGFPALDYLLHGVGNSDVEILEKYTTAENNANYKKYLTDVLNQMDTLTEEVSTGFKTDRDAFVASASNTATSSLNKLINDFIFYYEKGLRANKFGIPAGVFSSTKLPEKVEAFYKQDISKDLALESLSAVRDLFEGKNYNTQAKGESFETYLAHLKREDLTTAILNQFNAAETEINKVNNSFVVELNSGSDLMTRSYDELQKAVLFLKVDMLQAFNVSVDFVDSDGD